MSHAVMEEATRFRCKKGEQTAKRTPIFLFVSFFKAKTKTSQRHDQKNLPSVGTSASSVIEGCANTSELFANVGLASILEPAH